MQQFAAALPWLEPSEVGLAWLLFAVIFLTRRRQVRVIEQFRDRRAAIGLLLQVAGYGIVRWGLRTPGSGFLVGDATAGVVTAPLALVILAVSLLLAYAAVQTLGKQWSLAARLVQGHDLIEAGPYALVRHPIYTSMFGMLIGTAIAVSSWQALLIGGAVFLVGTAVRIRVEEQLLVAAFGDKYRSYAAVVPPFIPWIRLGRSGADAVGPRP